MFQSMFLILGSMMVFGALGAMEQKAGVNDLYSCIDAIFAAPKVTKSGNRLLAGVNTIRLLNSRSEKVKKLEQRLKDIADVKSSFKHLSIHPMIYALHRYWAIKCKKRNAPCDQDELIVGVVQAFLERDVSVNTCDKFGNTALYFAAMSHNVKLAEVLINCPEIDLNRQNNDGYAPLHLICLTGNLALLKLFLSSTVSKLYPNVVDKFNASPLHYLLGRPQENMKSVFGAVNLYPESQADQSYAVRYEGECMRRLKMLELLIDRGAYVTIADHSRCTPLHYAYHYQHEYLIGLLQERVNHEHQEKSERAFLRGREEQENDYREACLEVRAIVNKSCKKFQKNQLCMQEN